MHTLEEVKARFEGDRFARSSGAEIVSAGLGEAECRLALEDRHMNANSVPLGGAIFTLADFAYGVAANGCSGRNSVSQHVSITYLAPAKGNVLTARASCIRSGRKTCLYQVTVTDELGTQVAYATVNGFEVG